MFALMKCSFTPYQHLGQATLLVSFSSASASSHLCIRAVCLPRFPQYISNPTPSPPVRLKGVERGEGWGWGRGRGGLNALSEHSRL